MKLDQRLEFLSILTQRILAKKTQNQENTKLKRHKKNFYNLVLNVKLNKMSSIKSQDLGLVNITVYSKSLHTLKFYYITKKLHRDVHYIYCIYL
jgi:hypothetical protein